MPDVQCPVCGAKNPAGEEFCSFCNAELNPVYVDPKSEAAKEDLSNWLQSLRSADESRTRDFSQKESTPDWLEDQPEQSTKAPGDVGSRGNLPIESSSESTNIEKETPSWFRELMSEGKYSEDEELEPPVKSEFSGEASQWLSRLNGIKDEQYDRTSEPPDRLSETESNPPNTEQSGRSGLFYSEDVENATLAQDPSISLSDFNMHDGWNVEQREEKLPEESHPFLDTVEPPSRVTKDSRTTGSTSDEPFFQDGKEPSSEAAELFEDVEQADEIDFPATKPVLDEFKQGLQLETSFPDQMSSKSSLFDKAEKSASDFDSISGSPLDKEIDYAFILNEKDLGDLDGLSDEASSVWLSGDVFEDQSLETSESEDESDSGLVPAELPSWMQALRPVEATNIPVDIPVKTELEKPEVAGPLAGLRGALPAEPDYSQSQKPSPYSIKLQATDIQLSQVALLEEMIRTEGEAIPVPSRPEITSQHVLRIIFSLILVLSVLIPLVTGTPQVGLPSDLPGISRSIQLIDSISAGAPVLLAVDYTPGFSGEMDAVSASVVDHLMRQGAYLTLVSTTPMGPVQAERLIALVNREGNHGYGYSSQYINLGLIPGGFASLLRFSEAPGLVLPREVLGEPAWDNQPLNVVKDISGFAMVIVATENPDTARSWIEQVQPGLKSVPLILVVSSQAEPILRPYYDAIPQRVQGLIGGLAGGISYQSQIGKEGQAGIYWPSFSVSMMWAGLLIVFGGLINLAFAYLDRRKVRDQNSR